jgi:hypothetical protein
MSKFVLTNNLTKFKTSLDDFKVRGYKLSREITANNFYFACHHKRSLNDENILELPNGDFVCATGAFIYRGLKGIQALEKFYLEFKFDFSEFDKYSVFQGAIILFKNSKIQVFTDKYHAYWVYYVNNEMDFFVSNSLSNTIRNLTKKTLVLNSFIEAFTQRGNIGHKLFYKGVNRLFGNQQINIENNKFTLSEFDYTLTPYDFTGATVEEVVNNFSELLLDKFDDIQKAFNNQIAINQSGGLDSRLVLAAFLKLGYKPTLIYGIGNSPLTSQFNADYEIVKKLAKHFGLKTQFMDWKVKNIVDKEETNSNFFKYGFLSIENYCNNSWYNEYTNNIKEHSQVLLDGSMGEMLNIEGEDGIFGPDIPKEFNMDYIFDAYQNIFFNNFVWRNNNNKQDHISFLKGELSNVVDNVYKLPHAENIMDMKYYQRFWWARYRPADAHPTNLKNDFYYSYSPLAISQLHDFTSCISPDMVKKRSFSIKTISNLTPDLIKFDLFSRATVSRIENGKILRTGGRKNEILANVLEFTPKPIHRIYSRFKRVVSTPTSNEKHPMWQFYLKWLEENSLLSDIFDFSAQKGNDVRVLANTAIYANAINQLGYDEIISSD